MDYVVSSARVYLGPDSTYGHVEDEGGGSADGEQVIEIRMMESLGRTHDSRRSNAMSAIAITYGIDTKAWRSVENSGPSLKQAEYEGLCDGGVVRIAFDC
eukprot:scaffold149698_cov31-Tisochrysis_lutea.AAC.2